MAVPNLISVQSNEKHLRFITINFDDSEQKEPFEYVEHCNVWWSVNSNYEYKEHEILWQENWPF